MYKRQVFDSLEECEAYLLDDDSDMDENKVIILRGYGPKGAPGMPEFGNYLPIPPKLSRIGIRDYVRITDARMSGGAFGTVVLHVAPEAALGGPLAAVEDGDMIVLDVDRNRLELEVPDHVLQQRLQKISQKQHPDIERGFLRNFIDHVLQANEGCDMDLSLIHILIRKKRVTGLILWAGINIAVRSAPLRLRKAKGNGFGQPKYPVPARSRPV